MPGTAAAAGTAAVAAAAASAAGAPAGLMADMIAGIKTPLSRSIACPAPSWLAALDRSPSRPPLPLVAAGAMASDGSPRIGYVPAAGSNPMGAEIGTSPGAGSAAALEIGIAEYRFVRRYLERCPQAPLSLQQVDPLIRKLVQYRDLINHRTKECKE